MSQDVRQTKVGEQTQQLLEGPLKHVRAAALAAALLPLASVAAAPAAAQELCQSAGNVCGFVWNDADQDGVQDAGETGIEGAKVSLSDATGTVTTETGPDGFYYFSGVVDGTYTISVLIPQGKEPSPDHADSDTSLDSDGVSDGGGFSVASDVSISGPENPDTDFGFVTSQVVPVGTGTPGYWKNHPEAWPVDSISVGGVIYSVDEAIAWLKKVGKDKTTTMFSSLLAAKLNVLNGTNATCIDATIIAADAWLASNPLGSGVTGSSQAWGDGEPLHQTLDAYNNGLLCAPHRN